MCPCVYHVRGIPTVPQKCCVVTTYAPRFFFKIVWPGKGSDIYLLAVTQTISQSRERRSKLGVAAGVHTYLQHVNQSDRASPLEDQLPHMAAFLLARQEHWYYFGSTGWWDDDYAWDALYDKASTCGKATQPAPAVGSGPVYTRAFENCKVTLDCTNSSSCKGDIQFLTRARRS